MEESKPFTWIKAKYKRRKPTRGNKSGHNDGRRYKRNKVGLALHIKRHGVPPKPPTLVINGLNGKGRWVRDAS